MVELRKRPPPKEPPAPPPAAKKRGSKPKPGAANKASGSVTAKAKEAATKVKEAVVGEGTKDKQPTVEDAATPGDDTAKPVSTTGVSSTSASAGDTSKATIPVTATDSAAPAGSESGVGAAAAAPGPAVPSSMPPTESSKAEEDHNRPETSEALENPPETGKVEPATTAAQSAVIGGGIGPATHSASGAGASAASGSASVPLSTDSVGKLISLEGFGGVVETHDGRKVSVKDLLGEGAAKGGLVIFTYPRASTPGCTQQACMFRDNYQPITASGLAVYGLSTDSTKANSNFATKQNLPFPLLCDPQASLTRAIGMKKPGAGNGTLRGVIIIDGTGVVKVWFQGGPAKTLDVVMDFVKTMGK